VLPIVGPIAMLVVAAFVALLLRRNLGAPPSVDRTAG